MLKDIKIEELLNKQNKQLVVDVRSPKEFIEHSIPGSINIPVFSDEERAEVGTIYKQIGASEAKQRGLEIFSDKLPSFIKQFMEIKQPITVYCWRGGMRSKTAATVLNLMDIHVSRLKGGIRTYRQWVVSTLNTLEIKPQLIVLNGYTGTGKTDILKSLKDQGFPVIDLEGLAGHRGSIFGQIGKCPSNQKKFDALILEELLKFQKQSYILIEGESKRIGRVMLPDCLYDKKEHGYQVFIHLPIEERVRNIMQDYDPTHEPEKFLEAFQFIKKRIHQPIAIEIEMLLETNQFENAVKLLLEHYYDKRYEHSIHYDSEEMRSDIYGNNNEDVTQQLIELLNNRQINQS